MTYLQWCSSFCASSIISCRLSRWLSLQHESSILPAAAGRIWNSLVDCSSCFSAKIVPGFLHLFWHSEGKTSKLWTLENCLSLLRGHRNKFTEAQWNITLLKWTKFIWGRGFSQNSHLRLQMVLCIHTLQARSEDFRSFRGKEGVSIGKKLIWVISLRFCELSRWSQISFVASILWIFDNLSLLKLLIFCFCSALRHKVELGCAYLQD